MNISTNPFPLRRRIVPAPAFVSALALLILAASPVFCQPAAEKAAAELPPAAELLAAAIAYHDPDGVWPNATLHLQLEETRPGGPDRVTTLSIDNATGHFVMQRHLGEVVIQSERGADGSCGFEVDGRSEITDAERQEHGLNCERLGFMHNYYAYLWGQPMKLVDPGTRLDPVAERTTFDGRPVDGLKVTYEPGVGDDTWYFYFDPETHALVGYRFYHDEAAGDGEYILLDGELAAAGLRLPARRTWYTHQGDTLLGTDELVALTRPPR